MKNAITAALWLGTAGVAAAHTGHDEALTGTAHWLFSPLHGLGIAAVALVLWLIRSRRKE